jgi:membrane-associated protease RseP (regulator of RpoE activity)
MFRTLLILAVIGVVAFAGWRMLHPPPPSAVSQQPQPAASLPPAKNVGVVQEFALAQPAPQSPPRGTEKPVVLSTPTMGSKPLSAEPLRETPPAPMPPPAASQEKSYLGVYIGNVFKADAVQAGLENTYGAIVFGVTPDTTAAAAGLRAGDILTEFNGRRIPNARAVAQMIASLPPGSSLTIALVRNRVRQEVHAELRTKPDDAEIFRRLLLAADEGNVSAQVEVGKMFCNGIGVARDPVHGLRWLR